MFFFSYFSAAFRVMTTTASQFPRVYSGSGSGPCSGIWDWVYYSGYRDRGIYSGWFICKWTIPNISRSPDIPNIPNPKSRNTVLIPIPNIRIPNTRRAKLGDNGDEYAFTSRRVLRRASLALPPVFISLAMARNYDVTHSPCSAGERLPDQKLLRLPLVDEEVSESPARSSAPAENFRWHH